MNNSNLKNNTHKVNGRFTMFQDTIKCVNDFAKLATKYRLSGRVLERIINTVIGFYEPPKEYREALQIAVKALLMDYTGYVITDITQDGYYCFENGDIMNPETGEVIGKM